MTDNEIIKALECCEGEDIHFCSICPIYLHDKDNDFCQEDLHRMSLDLIKRQKAEIERLNNNISAMAITLSNSAKGTRAESRKEFAEELRSKARKYTEYDEGGWGMDVYAVEVAEIDNLLEEKEKET